MNSEQKYREGLTAMKYRQELAKQSAVGVPTHWYDNVETVLLWVVVAVAIGIIVGLVLGAII